MCWGCIPTPCAPFPSYAPGPAVTPTRIKHFLHHTFVKPRLLLFCARFTRLHVPKSTPQIWHVLHSLVSCVPRFFYRLSRCRHGTTQLLTRLPRALGASPRDTHTHTQPYKQSLNQKCLLFSELMKKRSVCRLWLFVICKYPSLFNSQVAQSLACDIVLNVATLRSCFVVLWNSFKLLELRREVYNRKVPDVYVLYPTAFFSCS